MGIDHSGWSVSTYRQGRKGKARGFEPPGFIHGGFMSRSLAPAAWAIAFLSTIALTEAQAGEEGRAVTPNLFGDAQGLKALGLKSPTPRRPLAAGPALTTG